MASTVQVLPDPGMDSGTFDNFTAFFLLFIFFIGELKFPLGGGLLRNLLVQLFDLVADEGEQRDLARDRPERAAELRGRLEAWRKEVGAAMPVPNPTPVDPFGPDGLPPKRKPAAAGR